MDSSRLFQSLTVLGRSCFVHVCLAEFNFKALRVVSCKVCYNVLVLIALDSPWSNRTLVPDMGDVVIGLYNRELFFFGGGEIF